MSFSPSDAPATSLAIPPRAQILEACRTLFAPSQIVELRVLALNKTPGRSAAGWFDNWDALADAAARYDASRNPEGIYFTLNPVHPGCLARAANHIVDGQKVTTSDADILRRHWLPIDLDPCRPSGISATDDEMRAACEMGKRVRAYLETELGFREPVRAMSGNGFHLLYRIDLPNDEASTKLVRGCLVSLAQRFSDPAVKIDIALSNPARIMKLYGTLARKGEALTDRPHRRSSLYVSPEFAEIPITSREALEQLAEAGRPPTSGRSPSSPSRTRAVAGAGAKKQKASTGGDFHAEGMTIHSGTADGKFAVDLEAWLRSHDVAYTERDGKYILDHCFFDASHGGTSACLARGSRGGIWYKCQHNSCAGYTWSDCRRHFGEVANPAECADPDDDGSAPANARTGARPRPSTPGDVEEIADDPWSLAHGVLRELFSDDAHVLIRRHRETWYQYEHKLCAYRVVADDTMRVYVTRWLGERVPRVTRSKLLDTLNALGSLVTAPYDLPMPFVSRVDPETCSVSGDATVRNWITCTNGIVDLDTILAGGEPAEAILEHTPEWFSLTALPYAFPTDAREADCPRWKAFLEEIFEGDGTRIDLLQEAFGYVLLPDVRFESFFIFPGQGQNGKSTVLGVLRRLLTEDSLASLSIEQLADKYLVYDLAGKLANVCADLNEMDRVAEGILKAVVSGDLITADRKFKSSVQFRCRCKLFFACNALPRFADTSLGIWRRMQVIPFTYYVPDNKKDTQLIDKLTEELPGILYWSVAGAIRLLENRGFTTSEVCQRATRSYKRDCFPILSYLEECCEQGAGHSATAGLLWTTYKRWCDYCGLKKPKPLHAFVKDLTGFASGSIHEGAEGLQSHATIRGVGLRPGLTFEDQRSTEIGAPGGAHGSSSAQGSLSW